MLGIETPYTPGFCHCPTPIFSTPTIEKKFSCFHTLGEMSPFKLISMCALLFILSLKTPHHHRLVLQASLVSLCFVLLNLAGVAFLFFYKLEAQPSTSKKIEQDFIVNLPLLQWSGAEPTVTPRYACISPTGSLYLDNLLLCNYINMQSTI